jgi:hypothetical protein
VTVEQALPDGIGLWADFLDRMPTPEAVAAVRDIEAAGFGRISAPLIAPE